MDYDVIVIGSGFGGAIPACRLAEAGYKVLVLERGRRWDRKSYPRGPEDPWFWNNRRPERENGWIDFRRFRDMSVIQGAAVGGGSLIYANISCEAPPETFRAGWPAEVTYSELKPHYDRVAKFMNVQRVPNNQWTQRMKLMQEAATKIGEPARFRQLELAVSFSDQFHYGLPDARNAKHSRRFVNAQGVEQGTCVHLGNCDIGCDVDAKNTLDRNYLAWAEKHHAEVRPLHVVSAIVPLQRGGYQVCYDRIDSGERISGSVCARIVIVAAGSLGSTELLLRCRDIKRTLPKLSPFLGRNWSSNGDFVTPAYHRNHNVSPTHGPTIASAIDFLDGSVDKTVFWIEDGGVPDLLGDCLRLRGKRAVGMRLKVLVKAVREMLGADDPFKHMMPWFAQAVDAADGLLSLRRPWWYFGGKRLRLDWDIARSEKAINTVIAMHRRLAAATDGTPIVPPTWTFAKDLITPHPLGGCNMGDTSDRGVVDHRGEVFGYRNLFVSDGAIIPEAIGSSPATPLADE